MFLTSDNLKKTTLFVLLLGLGIVFVGAVIIDLCYGVPLWRRLGLASYQEGGLEALALSTLIIVAAVGRQKWLYVLSVLAILFYLRRHNAELTILVAWLYIEALVAAGMVTLGAARRSAESGLVAYLITGICLWVLVVGAMSVVGWATAENTAIVLALVVGVLVSYNYKNLLVGQLVLQGKNENVIGRLLFGCCLSWVLVLAARTANVDGHDALWYLSQGDRLLAPTGSIFADLSLVAPVHYFPKLWEILILPLSVFGQMRIQTGFTIGFMILAGAILWQFCAQLNVPRQYRMLSVWLFITLPAVANGALSLKTDIICLLMLAAMVVFFCQWFKSRSWDSVMLGLAAAGLSVSSKYVAIPYVFVACVFLIVIYIVNWRRSAKLSLNIEYQPMTIYGWLPLLLAFVVAMMLMARTWLLTGAPTVGPDPLLSIWNSLGMELRAPVGTINWTKPQVWSEVPAMLYEWVWAPSRMGAVKVSWIGNYWLLFLIVAAVASIVGVRGSYLLPKGSKWLILTQVLVGLWTALAWSHVSRGGDGNYYVYPLLLLTGVSVALLVARLQQSRILINLLVAVTVLIGSFHCWQSFLLAGWDKPGTRKFDLALAENPLPKDFWLNSHLVDKLKLGEVVEYLQGQPRQKRLVAFYYRMHIAGLPVASEAMQSIIFTRKEYAGSVENMMKYLREYNIDYLLLSPLETTKDPFGLLPGFYQKAEDEAWPSVKSEGGTLYRIKE